jgi:HAAS domain-containing protein
MITKTTQHRLVREYLRHLDRALAGAPRPAARELRGQIAAHLNDALTPDASEAEVRTVLDQLGTPETLAAEITPVPVSYARARWVDVLALLLLSFGALVFPVIGWLVGAALLASSPRFTGRQKALGLLVWPLGPLLPVASLAIAATGPVLDLPSAIGVSLGIAAVAAPFVVVTWLASHLNA